MSRAAKARAARAEAQSSLARHGEPPTAAAFAAALLERELAALAASIPRAGAAPTPAAVHAMRIATRRLRVALDFFAEVLPGEERAALAAELRWLARELGAVRDLDVFAERWQAALADVEEDERPALGGYELEMRKARKLARERLGASLAGDRSGALAGRRAALLAALSTAAAGDVALRELAPPRIRRSLKRVLRKGARVAEDTPASKLHRLRIHAKRLRYAAELCPGEPWLAELAQSMKSIQDVLGELQDASGAAQRLRRYALDEAGRAPDGGSSPAAGCRLFTLGRLMQAQQQRAEQARARFIAEWPALEKRLRRLKRAARAAADG